MSQKTKALTIPRILKADTQTLVTAVPLEVEDGFSSQSIVNYQVKAQVLEPPYNPTTLREVVQRNNVLPQCVEAMEVNVDGTGWEIRLKQDEKGADEREQQVLQDFFTEPYPGVSFTTIRRAIRKDLEETGMGYLEVLRNVKKEIVFLRHLDATTVRMLKLSEPRLVTKTVVRGGQEVSLSVWVRERRFAQVIGSEMVFYREFGSSRDLSRKTGEWGENIPADQLATEVIPFLVNKDVNTPYGLPRWINNTPAVLGSRKAEEFNLSFFDSGGLPPVIVFVQGGSITEDVSQALQLHLSGRASDKQRGIVIEAYANSGTLDSAGKVDIKVERFGADATKDAMFQVYDKNCEEHTRVSFRLPPLFIGRSEDLNFASAQASYLVAEAQVFKPERDEFDEIINRTVCRALGAKKYEFRSLPLSVKDVEVQLKALGLVKDKVDGEHLVESVNDIAGLDLVYSQDAEAQSRSLVEAQANALNQRAGQDTPQDPQTPAVKSEDPIDRLVSSALILQGLALPGEEEPLSLAEVEKAIGALGAKELALFQSRLAAATFKHLRYDTKGLGEIAGCVASFLGCQGDH